MNLAEKLQKIQFEMKAPKNLFNKFGNYSYRNAEGILEAFKPFGEKYKVVLVLNDEIVNLGDRYYIKATATLYDAEDLAKPFSNSAYARESFDKKGMDDSQITGTASSYARKYALNGLFLLDDTKDSDTEETPNKASKEQVEEILKLTPDEKLQKVMLNYFGVKKFEDLTEEQAFKAIEQRKKKIAEEAKNE